MRTHFLLSVGCLCLLSDAPTPENLAAKEYPYMQLVESLKDVPIKGGKSDPRRHCIVTR